MFQLPYKYKNLFIFTKKWDMYNVLYNVFKLIIHIFPDKDQLKKFLDPIITHVRTLVIYNSYQMIFRVYSRNNQIHLLLEQLPFPEPCFCVVAEFIRFYYHVYYYIIILYKIFPTFRLNVKIFFDITWSFINMYIKNSYVLQMSGSTLNRFEWIIKIK